jgi:hypothetical protein
MRESAPETAKQAMDILESRGLKFTVHFGVCNAESVLEELDRSAERGKLGEWQREKYGPMVVNDLWKTLK